MCQPELAPVHAGLAFGPVLHRSGDVFGPVVNIAARIAGLARQGTVRTDTAMATALADSTEFTLAARAPRRVRGYCNCAPTGCAEPTPRCLWTAPHDGAAGAVVSIRRSCCRPPSTLLR